MTDYKEYCFSKKEWLIEVFRAAVEIVFLGFLFFRSVIGCFLLLPYAVRIVLRRKVQKNEERKRQLRVEFGEAVLSVAASLQAGYALEQTIEVAAKDMERIHGKTQCLMVQELEWMKKNLALHVPMEQLFKDFARRSGVEEIRSFSTILAVAKRQGGNMVKISVRAAKNISLKIQVQSEIDQVLAGRKLEQKIMVRMPYFILLYLQMTNPSYLEPLFHQWSGRILMFVCLTVTLAAREWADYLVRISV